MLPICFTHGLALLSHYYKSSTCVCSVIFSLQRRCMGVLCCYFRPKMFSPGDHVRYHSRTLGAHVLAIVVGPTLAIPPPPGDRHLATVSPPHPGDRRALTRDFARGGERVLHYASTMVEHQWKWSSVLCYRRSSFFLSALWQVNNHTTIFFTCVLCMPPSSTVLFLQLKVV